jgi:hypothetical protein
VNPTGSPTPRHRRLQILARVAFVCVPLLSFGYLTGLAFGIAAVLTRSAQLGVAAAVYITATAVVCGLSQGPQGMALDVALFLGLIVNMLAGTVHAAFAQRRLFRTAEDVPLGPVAQDHGWEATLTTPTTILGRLGPFGKARRGELDLADGVLTLMSHERPVGRLFMVPTGEVRARFPMLYFGLGVQLIVAGRRHRLWFVPLRSAVGMTTGPVEEEQTIIAGNAFYIDELRTARSTTQRWRAALRRR